MGVALEVLFCQDHFFPDSNSQPWGHQEGAQNEPKPSVQVTDDTLNKLTTQIYDVRKVLLHKQNSNFCIKIVSSEKNLFLCEDRC